MSAYLELRRDRSPGPEFAELLYATVEQAVRHGRYPPPDGQRWRPDDYLEVAHDFLGDGNGQRRITSLALRASDDESLRKLLWTAVVNCLRDRARVTDRGALRRQLVDFVRRDDNRVREVITPAGPALTLADVAEREPWHGDEQTLVAAAWEVDDIKLQRWRQAARRSPIAEAESLSRVLENLIQHAKAPVLLADVLPVIEHRFALSAPPTIVDVDDEPALASEDDPASTAVARDAAAMLFDQLTARERVAVAHYDLPVRELAAKMGVGKSTAANVKATLESILVGALRGDPDAEATWEALRTEARRWTDGNGATSDVSESQ